jgi:nitronate monooxygenase
MEDESARTSDENAFNRSLAPLAVHIAALGSPRPEYKPYSWIRFEDQARVLLDEKIPVSSFIWDPATRNPGRVPGETHRHDWHGDHT